MKRGLGRGLDSLFGGFDEEKDSKNKEVEVKIEQVVVNEPKEIDIGLIDRNPEQPRKIFDDDALAELSASIKNYGVIQPIIVKEVNKTAIFRGLLDAGFLCKNIQCVGDFTDVKNLIENAKSDTVVLIENDLPKNYK